MSVLKRGDSDDGDAIFDVVSTYINDRFVANDEATFRPSWVLVAQWDGVHPHPSGSDDHEGIDEEYLNRVSKSYNSRCEVGHHK